MKKIRTSVILTLILSVLLPACGRSNVLPKYSKEDVVVSVAKAFYLQGTQILYDQYNARRNYNAMPEDATAQNNLYLDCSSFINSVYYYVFGKNLLDGKSVSTSSLDKEFSVKTPDKDGELLFYITGDELFELKADSEKAAAKISEIKKSLRPGDIINYRRSNNTGHVVMYIGDQKIIHSTGSANPKTSNGDVNPKTSIEKYSADEKAFGSVTIDDWDRFFTKTVTPLSQNDGRTGTSNNYLFADNISSVAVIRPLSEKDGRFGNVEPLKAAISRLQYEGLDVEKTATVNGRALFYGNSVRESEEITYTVKIANNSKKTMKGLTASETIPAELEYVSSCKGSEFFEDENKITMEIGSLKSGKTVEFVYTLRVKDLPGGTVINDSETYVSGIKTNALINQFSVSSAGSSADLSAAQAVYESFKSGKNFKDESFSAVLYGGFKLGSEEISAAIKDNNYEKVNVRVRRVMESFLEDGDIIVTYSSNLNEQTAFLFFDGNVYGILADGNFGKLSPSKLSIGASGTVQDFLDTLTAYDSFSVVRPRLLG